VTPKTGGQADAFNAVFGIKTDFAAVAEVDDQGNVVSAGSSITGSTVATTTTTSAPVSTSTLPASGSASTPASPSAVGNFGTCSTPQIEFGVGFDGRKETAFQPVDKTSFNHGSADNIDIITSFICSQLASACKADATAQTTCQTATTAADAATKGTGAQADAFNAAFGLTTNFVAVTEVNNQGNNVAGTGSGASTSSAVTTTGANNAVVGGSSSAASSAIGNFGSCTVPQIEFATGFDNRKETSFQPVDKTSFNHGSAQNIDIITQAICDTLTNSCGADATAKATCAKAQAAADTVTPKTGGQADAFNAVFGIKTDFTAVAEVDDQGNVVPGTGSASTAAAGTTTGATSTAGATDSSTATSTASTSSIGNFGSCSIPQIEFATGFDNRKETSFQPVDKISFNHGSAQNIDIITQAICDTLTNSCGADATAKATCAKAQAAADTVTPKTGGQADAFNAVFGIKTDFAAVAEVDDQGNVVSAGSSA
jgi:uncharacterized protein with GYD domain